ncbi:hypothetical protein H0H93_008300, partial [Arthromyces matolae]
RRLDRESGNASFRIAFITATALRHLDENPSDLLTLDQKDGVQGKENSSLQLRIRRTNYRGSKALYSRQSPSSALTGAFQSAYWIYTEALNNNAPADDKAFRATYTPPSGVSAVTANILITADDYFTLYVNGQVVGDTRSLIGTGTTVWANVHGYAVTLNIKGVAPIVFAVIVSNNANSASGLLAAMQIVLSDGSSTTIASGGGGWRATSSIPQNFADPGLNDSGWGTPVVLSKNGAIPGDGILSSTMKLNAFLSLSGLLAAPVYAASSKKPNFLFILTDDQDLKLNSLDYTPLTVKHIRDKGLDFTNHFVTTALCCPSRVSLWTGRQAHNTNVTDVSPPYGGYPKFVSQGFNDDWFFVWLQNAGYNTYYTGKLMNGHSVATYNEPFVNGFNTSDFLLDPYTYSYWQSAYQRNHDAPVSYAGNYTTDVITDKALGLLEDALDSDRPFFLTVAPIAPHSNLDPAALSGGESFVMEAPIPAPRHANLFNDTKVPRTPSFNPLNVCPSDFN